MINDEHKLMDNKSLLCISLYLSVYISIFLYLLSLSLLKLKIALTQVLENAPLTLYLMGGGIARLPLAKIAPVHQGVTFLIIFFDDNSYLYIY